MTKKILNIKNNKKIKIIIRKRIKTLLTSKNNKTV